MASNYWASTQYRHWQCPPAVLLAVRQELEDREKQLIQQYPLPEWRHLSLFFNQRKQWPHSPFNHDDHLPCQN